MMLGRGAGVGVALSIALALCGGVPSAGAEPAPVIVVLDTDAGVSLPALVAQLRLHAGEVAIEPAPAGGSALETRLAAASALLEERDATLVLWIDPVSLEPGDQRGFIAYAVGRWPGRAVMELVRIEEGAPAEEVERIVALKVGNLLDTLLVEGQAPPVLGGAPAPVRPARRWRVDLGAAVTRGGDPGAIGGAVAAVERVLAAEPARLAVGVRVRWLPAAGVAADGAQLELDEGAAALAITGGVGRDGWAVVGAAQLGGSLLRARAIVDDGREGTRTVVVPSFALGAQLRIPLSGAVEATIEAGHEWWLLRQRFLVDDDVVGDLGAGRLYVGVGVSVPFR